MREKQKREIGSNQALSQITWGLDIQEACFAIKLQEIIEWILMLTKPRLEDEELAQLISAQPSVQEVSSLIASCAHKSFFWLLSRLCSFK